MIQPVGDQLTCLPDNSKFLIQTETLVGSNDGDLFCQSLGDDLAIERIAVMKGKRKQFEDVGSAAWQHAGSHVFQSLFYGFRGEVELSAGRFQGDLCD